MAALYESGKSTAEIAEQLGVSRRGVTGALTKRGVKVVRRNKYACDHGFFDVIDSESKAYWLGFLFADGNVSLRPRAAVRVALAIRDKDHLERLQEALRSNHPIYEISKPLNGKTYGQAILHVASPRMARALTGRGMTPNKTYTVRWPRGVPNHLTRHFVRGFFDGDGTWFVHPTVRGQVAFQLVCANPFFLEDFKSAVQAQCEVGNPTVFHDARRDDKKRNTYSLGFRGAQQCARLFSFLYHDASIWLPRKYEQAARRFVN